MCRRSHARARIYICNFVVRTLLPFRAVYPLSRKEREGKRVDVLLCVFNLVLPTRTRSLLVLLMPIRHRDIVSPYVGVREAPETTSLGSLSLNSLEMSLEILSL